MKEPNGRSHSRDRDVADRSTGKGCILVVEDDVEVADMLRIYFEAKDYRVLIAPRGDKALEICENEPPNVVLLDVILPGIDGYEVCRRMKSNPRTRNVPIIFLTHKGDRADKIAGLGLGADEYITKPFDITDLESSVARLTERT